MTSINRASAAASDTLAYTDLHSLQKINQAEGDEALKKVAKQFESMFVHMLFKGMRQSNAVFEEGNFGHSAGEKMYRDMYDQQMSLNIADGRGLGIADMVFRQLKGVNGAEPTVNDHGFRVTDQLPPVKTAARRLIAEQAPLNVNDAVPGDINEASILRADSPESFVKSLYPAVKRFASQVGLDPAIMVAQAALETGWGKHIVGGANAGSNNLFNIKADSRWSGEKVNTQTLEYKNGIAVQEHAQFRKYTSIEESIQDFIQFVQDQPRYQSAWQHKNDGLSFIRQLHQAGYATDPQYSEKVQAVYQRVQDALAADAAEFGS